MANQPKKRGQPNMFGQSRLSSINGTYYFRAVIPEDVRVHFGRKVIKESLKTKDKAKARILCGARSLEIDKQILAYRVRAGTAQLEDGFELADDRATPVQKCDEVLNHDICEFLREDERKQDEILRFKGSDIEDLDHLKEQQAIFRQAYAQGNRNLAWELIQALSGPMRLDFVLGLATPGIETLMSDVLRTKIKTLDEQIARREGNVSIDDLLRPPKRVSEQFRTFSFEKMIANWQAVDQRGKTVDEFTRVADAFSDYIGSTLPASATRADAIGFRDNLLREKKNAPATVKKKIGVLKTLYRNAVSDGKLEVNPFETVIVKRVKTEEEKRLPFDADDLKTIFEDEIFIENKRPLGGAGEAAYWLPLLGLFTGARLEELAQLQPKHIFQPPESKDWFIRITDQDGGALKNTQSRREVPVHPELIRLGFINYVGDMRAEKKRFLFSNLKPDKYEKRHSSWSKWFNRYLRETLEIDDKRKVFHSFRHGFKSACRASIDEQGNGIPEEIHDCFTGHTTGSVGRTYGGSITHELLTSYMNRVRFKGLSLEHLKPYKAQH